MVFLLTLVMYRVNDLVNNLKQKDYAEVRKWCVNNLDNDPAVLMRRIYDSLYESLIPATIPAAVSDSCKVSISNCFRCRSRDQSTCMSNRNYGRM